MRAKKNWIVVLFAALFAAVLLYGIYSGDPDYVFKNADNFCFT